MSFSATIAALSTAPGGAVGILRVSGPAAVAVAARVWRGTRPLADSSPRMLELGWIIDRSGAALDRAMAVRFAAPNSYTGEEMVELHCHGSRLVAARTLGLLFASGAREARPGEFTQRAFLNGKMDLTQAEAVADLIAAHSDRALRLANRHLAGVFGRRTDELYRQAEQLLAEAEARLDFPEEDLTLTPPETLCAAAASLEADINRLLAGRRQGEILRHGIRVVIAGPPNAGKSSLLNAILGRDRAIVTPLPGTTRDTLEEWVSIHGLPVCLVDTAGIRETHDEVETDGIRRAHEARAAADIELWLMDATQPLAEQLAALGQTPGATTVIPVLNKMDLLPAGFVFPGAEALSPVALSAKTGAGLDELFGRIEAAVLPRSGEDAEVAVNERHAALLENALEAVAESAAEMRAGRWELAAVTCRGVLDALGRITGKTHTPDVLDTIFSKFCIGK